MAMSCDYRIMATGKYTIGLNETLLVSDFIQLCERACVCVHGCVCVSVLENIFDPISFIFSPNPTTAHQLITAM